ncbi:hypothetical protein FACS1894133_2300 [Clostridia bacterium]|nr:hypothetical protein FACS1894133_2300 [Clostridia bacterium]
MKQSKIRLNRIRKAKVKAIRKSITAKILERVKPDPEQLRLKKEAAKLRVENARKFRHEQKQKALQRRTAKQKQESVTVRRANIFRELSAELKTAFNISNVSVYYFDDDMNMEKLYGESIGSSIIIEKYFSYANTVIIISPGGLADNASYKCRYVTRLFAGGVTYMVCLSSYAFEAFRDDTGVTITRKIKDVSGKLEAVRGETINTL